MPDVYDNWGPEFYVPDFEEPGWEDVPADPPTRCDKCGRFTGNAFSTFDNYQHLDLTSQTLVCPRCAEKRENQNA